MKPAVLGACTITGSAAELRARAATFTSRRVLRLLDSWSLAPFVTVMELKADAWPEDWDGERTGLITISDLEPGFGGLLPAGAPEEGLAHVLERKPTEWLREMANNPACQASIVSQLRGPTLHYVGDADTCRLALLEAAAWLESGTADRVLVVAFDEGDFPGAARADDGRSQAAGVALGGGDAAALGDTDRLTGGAGAPGTAVAAMTDLVAAFGQAAPERAG
ncbi:MAG TPA: hypothetical protein VFH94_26125 [Streptomyces sp.]|nr:hypothetical protein [Streptomyces sp.]